jgi:hypothetical protein
MNKDLVRRILAVRYHPKPDAAGPSWLTVLGHAKDRLWSVDLFRCESLILRAHWVLVVMDQCTRRIVGFGVHRGAVDGVGLCRMFNSATRGHTPPTYFSSDHDRLYQFHQWQANLRILDVEESRRCRTRRSRIRSSNDSLARFDGNAWTAPSSGRRSGDETPRVPALLQRSSRPYGAGGESAGIDLGRGRRPRESPFVSLADALSWALSHADGSVRCVRDTWPTPATSGRVDAVVSSFPA